MKKLPFLIFLFTLFLNSSVSFAQDNLMSMLEEENPVEEGKVSATFKSMKIINAHTIEMVKEKAPKVYRKELIELLFEQLYSKID